ncbi:MAG: FAD binding domain-containing protein [Solirubrobacterales bacterium]|nr:FAD binding domain-containing protein [Solirubrobacterales bacterium]
MSASLRVASTVEEAVHELAAGARPVAGGTDLVVGARQGKAPLPQRLVAIHRIEKLRRIAAHDQSLRMGALVTHAELAANPTVRSRLTALADACVIVGSHATRAFGTIGGNLMNASPAMETGGPLLCLDATVALRSASGARRVGIAELLAGPGQTTAAPDELLEEVYVALPPTDTGSSYVRLEYRRAMEIAVVGATAVIRFDGDRIAHARVAITALAPTIRRVPDAEAALVGSDAGTEAAQIAARAVAAASEPISDIRASSRYRTAMATVVARRAIAVAAARAKGEDIPVPASTASGGGPR